MTASLLLSRIQELDASQHANSYLPLVMGGQCIGQVHVSLLADILQVDGDDGTKFWFTEDDENGRILLLRLASGKDINEALNAVTDHFIRVGRIKQRHGDVVPVPFPSSTHTTTATTTLVMDRNTAPFLGVPSVGVHLNCFFMDPKTGDRSLWMAQRAAEKSTFPNAWDVTVAGGQPYGLTLENNLRKEAMEEAGIPAKLVHSKAKSVGCLSQMTSKPDGTCLKHSLYYCWDMEVSSDFVPNPTDGEVAKFELWNSQTLLEELLRGTRLRPAMKLVVADYLIRHGVITPGNEPDYAKIQMALHRDRLVLWQNRTSS